MKVIDQSPVRADLQPYDKFKTYFKGVVSYGWDWIADVKAEEIIIESLRPFLDNSYFTVRNVLLEGIDVPIPLVLVGPSGIYVLLASGEKGVFRAKGEVWMEMNRQSRKYAPVRKNLLARVQLMARVVDAFLSFHQQGHPAIQNAVLFANAGAHVDSARSAVRVVLKDGIQRFANSVTEGKAVFNTKDEIVAIVEALTGKLRKSEEALPEAAPAEEHKPNPVGKLVNTTKKLGLTTRQWIMLGLMAFVEALILVVIFVFVIVLF